VLFTALQLVGINTDDGKPKDYQDSQGGWLVQGRQIQLIRNFGIRIEEACCRPAVDKGLAH